MTFPRAQVLEAVPSDSSTGKIETTGSIFSQETAGLLASIATTGKVNFYTHIRKKHPVV